MAREFMNTKEVADYLRIKQRKVYALLRAKRIPCSRVTGKWLFPKHLIDLWVAENTDYAGLGFETRPPAPVVAGSHDPLLDWAVRESGCGLALRASGSLDGLKQLAAGEAVMAGLHVRDTKTGEYNVPILRDAAGLREGSRFYLIGASFWELNWAEALKYFNQIAGYGLWDGTMTVSERIHFASMRYGDQLLEQGQACDAVGQYKNAQAIAALDQQAQEGYDDALSACYPPTPTIDLTLSVVPIVTTEIAPAGTTPARRFRCRPARRFPR